MESRAWRILDWPFGKKIWQINAVGWRELGRICRRNKFEEMDIMLMDEATSTVWALCSMRCFAAADRFTEKRKMSWLTRYSTAKPSHRDRSMTPSPRSWNASV